MFKQCANAIYLYISDINNKLNIFFVMGLGLGLLLACYFCVELFPLSSKQKTHILYLFSGTVFPAAIIAFGLWHKYAKTYIRTISVLLTILIFLVFVFYSYSIKQLFWILGLPILITLCERTVSFYKGYKEHGNFLSSFLLVLLAVVAWELLGRTVFWTSIYKSIIPNISIFIPILFFTIYGLFRFSRINHNNKTNAWFDFVAILVLMIFAFKYIRINTAVNPHHMGAYAISVNGIRNGGWLLFDVPSQYGFLNILLMSLLPFKNIITSIKFLNGVLLTISSALLYFSFIDTKSSLSKKILALLVAVLFTFYVAGWFPTLAGIYSLPSTGAMRFIWVYILIYFMYQTTIKRSLTKDSLKTFIISGNSLFVLSCIWSAESAAYAIAIWLPAFYCVLTNNFTFKEYSKSIAAYLSPLISIGVTILIISIYYWVRINNLPDYLAYFDYITSFVEGFGNYSASYSGGAWYFMLIFIIICTALYKSVFEQKYSYALPIALSCFGGFWATFSYFIPRSHPNNLLNIAPVLLFIVSIVMNKVIHRKDYYLITLSRLIIMPMVCIYLSHAFVRMPRNFFHSIYGNYLHQKKHTFKIDPVLQKFLVELQSNKKIDPRDNISFLVNSTGLLPDWNNPTQLLYNTFCPMNSILSNPLSYNRIEKYLTRHIALNKKDGWIIYNKALSHPEYRKIFSRYYKIAEKYTKGDWAVIKYEYIHN